MKVYRGIWGHMAVYESICRYMRVYGSIWRYMEVCEGMCGADAPAAGELMPSELYHQEGMRTVIFHCLQRGCFWMFF